MHSVRSYLIDRLGVTRTASILNYLEESGCSLVICKPRKTKLGDFRVKGKSLKIKVNNNLNQYRFILTLIHEIAHLKTYLEFKTRVAPHGEQWKNSFRQLMSMWNIEELFSNTDELKLVYAQEVRSPRACAGIHLENERHLSVYDEGRSGVMLHELEAGTEFIFRDRTYRKLEQRRTRILCLNMDNNKLYTIHKASLVSPLNS